MKTTSMKLLTAKEIKKIVIGIVISDGHIDVQNNRFDLYSKQESYARYVYEVLSQITHMHVHFKVKRDKRGYIGYRVWTRKHAYWKNLGSKFYTEERKVLTSYISKRVDALAFAHIWMCDGYLYHAKNRKLDKIQNVGIFCLESFPAEELEYLQTKLLKFGIESTLMKVPWGYGYRIRIGGKNLQKFISLVYLHILDCFKYKTPLFYRKLESANMDLPSAEQYVFKYESIDDIVRHPLKKGTT